MQLGSAAAEILARAGWELIDSALALLPDSVEKGEAKDTIREAKDVTRALVKLEQLEEENGA